MHDKNTIYQSNSSNGCYNNFLSVSASVAHTHHINLTHFCPMFPFFTPENTRKQRFSGVFSGYKMETLARNGLITKYSSDI